MRHDRKLHLVFGITLTVVLDCLLFGAGTGFLEYHSGPLRLLLVSVFSGFGAMLPDTLEPPRNSRHRGFLHSYSLGAILLVMLLYAMTLGTLGGRILFYALAGYLSHLLYDSTTRRGLPWA